MERRISDNRPASVPERRRGRPRVLETSAAVTTWLPAKEHDRLIRIANEHEISVSALVRRVLILTLR